MSINTLLRCGLLLYYLTLYSRSVITSIESVFQWWVSNLPLQASANCYQWEQLAFNSISVYGHAGQIWLSNPESHCEYFIEKKLEICLVDNLRFLEVSSDCPLFYPRWFLILHHQVFSITENFHHQSISKLDHPLSRLVWLIRRQYHHRLIIFRLF